MFLNIFKAHVDVVILVEYMNRAAVFNVTGYYRAGDFCLKGLLHITFQRACAVNRVVAVSCAEVKSSVGNAQDNITIMQSFLKLTQNETYNFAQVGKRQRLEADHLIYAVQEFRTELCAHESHDITYRALRKLALVVHTVYQYLSADIAGHNYYCVLEVDEPAVAVCHAAIIKNLQHNIENIRMGLLNFVKKDDGIRMPANGLCQLSAFLITDISRRRSNKARDCMLFHILGHINSHHIIF